MGNESSDSLRDLDKYSMAKKAVLLGPSSSKEVKRCPYREGVRTTDKGQVAHCGRVVELTGVADPDLCEIRRDTCEFCCRSDAPVDSGINTVVASLLYTATSTIIERGGAHGCDVGKASHLHELAEANLECAYPESEDNCDIGSYRRRIEDCQYFGKKTGDRLTTWQGVKCTETVFECSYPEQTDTTANQCRLCRHWTNGQRVTVPRLSEAIPAPRNRCGPEVATWAVGVTTSPRKEPTIDICLDSLARAGWKRPWLFVDEGTNLADHQLRLPVTYRQEKAGAWSNFYLAMQELLMRQPDADAYLLVQDDALFYDGENVREYLDSSLWPDGNIAAVSLYCPEPYTRRRSGWHRYSGKWIWGAQTFVFPNQAARQFVIDHDVFEHRWAGHLRHAQIDVVIGEWALRNGLNIYYPVPSLVQHIGQTSTLWPAGRVTGKRKASLFLGDMPSDRTLPEKSEQATQSNCVHNSVGLSKLAVVTCFFDPNFDRRRLDNHRRFVEGMRGHDIEVFTVEGVLRGERTSLPPDDHTTHLELESVLWQKERLLNPGIAALPAEVDAVGWFDADVLFHHDDFQEAILAALDESPVIQPWQICEWLDADGRFVRWSNGKRWAASLAARNWGLPPGRKNASPSFGHPGLAWAARRETIDAFGGLFDQLPLGGGDTTMAICFWGDWRNRYHDKYNDPMRQVVYEWGKRAHRVIQGNVGFVDAAVSHLWHGSRESRRYAERHWNLSRLGFDPSKHLESASNETWKWSASTPQSIIDYVTEYFAGRREDREPEA